MLGVNILNLSPSELKKIMLKEKINWRTFAHGDKIAKQWGSPPTPAFYLIDPKGVIRHKWIGHPCEKTLDLIVGR